MKNYSRIFWVCTGFASLLAAAGVGLLLFGLVLPAQNDLLTRNLFERVESTADMAQPLFKKALDNRDDILLLIQTENLARIPDVSSVYLLDSSSTVTMHNLTGEWGKKYTDACSQRAAITRTSLLQPCDNNKGYLYSVPLNSTATLCVQISDERISVVRAFASRRALFAGAGLALALASLAFVFFRLRIEMPFRRLLTYIRASGPGLDAPVPADPTGIAAAVKDLNFRYRRDRELVQDRTNSDRAALNRLVDEAVSSPREVVAVFDADGRVLSVTGRGREILGIAEGSDPRGKHLLDAVTVLPIVSDVNAVSVALGTTIQEHRGNTPVNIRSVVSSDEKLAGVLVEVEKK